MRICQLQTVTKPILQGIIFSIIFGACTTIPVDTKRDERVIVANWNKLALRFAHVDDKDQAIAHPFFDVSPEIKNLFSSKGLNLPIKFIVTTPKDSLYQYDFDIYSGKLFRERKFCPQDDIWQDYRADLTTPNFTQGIIPRVYGEDKKPMKVIVISSKEVIEPFKENPDHYDDVRIVGSVILENCENYPCDIQSKWKPKQILVGVSPKDPKYQNVDNFLQLKKSTDWPYTKGMLNNMFGTHRLGNKSTAAFRLTRELNLKDSFDYFSKTATVLTYEKLSELNVIRSSCLKMYDEMWTEAEKIRGQKEKQQDLFFTFFKDFYSKKSTEFYECQKFVRPATIIENPRRHWFFTFIQAFTILEKNGFYYSCGDNAWAYNPKVDENTYFVDQNKELARCRARNFEKAFDQAINGMGLMKSQTNRQYRFIEYDNGRGGSHQKIFAWIYDKVQYFECKYQTQKPNQSSFEIFPQDVIWENFQSQNGEIVR